MEGLNRKQHWENIYQTKALNEVSWYQPVPQPSLGFLEKLHIPKQAKIIDMGGGDSFLADHLLEQGYTDITVLDISESALKRAQDRLGSKAGLVKWIVADAAAFIPQEQYDVWHDRAAFHFLTREEEIAHYIGALQTGIKPGGILILGTFSEAGPKKCSGIEIRQYSQTTLKEIVKDNFEALECINVDHNTPFETIQNFVFCSFRKEK